MRLVLFSILSLLAAPAAVLSCEGECIVGITNQFITLYAETVSSVMDNIASQICKDVAPQTPTASCSAYVQPLMDAWNSSMYNPMEHAIFPSYFHGKCQNAQGVDPPGCPNPDCPVVCGTPGSLVHFYSTLQNIVFDTVNGFLVNNTKPNSDVYNEIKKAVTAGSSTSSRRALGPPARPYPPSIRPRAGTIDKSLQSIFKGLPHLLQQDCGGPGLPNCSWETYMKKFILSYP
ncbi:hypothetical protein SERLADRAFT_365854 [Serpula lacrymans var. lacrymans S7.9]|uniref:Uncharacterized protein n=1 Tax=Serpula lacrymans var. lacrymans (strain S7.9) TaxID=578457 RepID=F8NJF1_SERL9|nr:uncharacterized protein SERLADRAFT_365854 [Serpula lacrymans var. lacrymans S7.9]EGO29849.1 hypothetical protein SERLADRAFT_365854 [Serpula lacrymans var. lacrymans S7.9]